MLAALAGVTDRLGLTGTINTTFNEPFEVARQFATLDHLSDGRAGWNMVTSSDAFTGENFRRGGFLDHADRYHRAEEFIAVARKFWDSWAADAVAPTVTAESTSSPAAFGTSSTTGPSSTFAASPRFHRRPGRAGVVAGRRFRRRAGVRRQACRCALHAALRAQGRPAFYADVKGRAVSYGRDPDQLKVFPAATFVLGDTARKPPTAPGTSGTSRSAHRPRSRCSTGLARDLSAYDPDGPLPDIDPADDPTVTQGRVRHGDPKAVAAKWRERAEAENLSIRELVIAVTSRQQFVGTPAQVADEIDLHVQADACDGFILVPHLTPHGLDDFVDRVVPLLQERGVSVPNTPATPSRTPRPIGWPEVSATPGVVSITQTTVGWLLLGAEPDVCLGFRVTDVHRPQAKQQGGAGPCADVPQDWGGAGVVRPFRGRCTRR